MAVQTNDNPKPFTCANCKKAFVSFEKLNHHAHKEHGVPRNLSLNINAVRSNNLQPPDAAEGDTPTPSRYMGELGDITGLPRDVGDLGLPMSSMLADYNLTPSVFDQDFKLSIGNIAEKGAPATTRRPSPRVKQQQLANATANSRTKDSSSSTGSSVTATQYSNTVSTNLAGFTAMPKSPGAYFITHINAAGQYVSSPLVPSPLLGLQQQTALQLPFQFPVPGSPVIRPGGLMFAPSVGFAPMMAVQDPLTSQLQTLWASSTLEALRDSNTPKTEVSSNEEEDSKSKKRGAKRKAEEIDESVSDSMSIHSEMSGTPARRARPILETDDPVLADKRRRNRIAAEKCRIKRKDRQTSLEGENDVLKDKIRLLEKNTAELTRVSKEVVKKLQNENLLLKAENANFRRQLQMGVQVPLIDGQPVMPSTAGFPLSMFKAEDSEEST